MKRKRLNETFQGGAIVCVDVLRLSDDFPGISIDELAEMMEEEIGTEISKVERDNSVFMLVDGTDVETVTDVIEDFLLTNGEVDDSTSVYDTIIDYVTVEYDDMDDIDESYDYPEYDEIEDFDPDEYPGYNEDEFYESVDNFDDDDMLTDDFDECEEFDECEDKEFECYESRNYRSLGNGIYEKKKGCCPPRRRSNRMVNLSESLKRNRKRSIKRPIRINESVYKRAMRKAKTERPNIKKMIKESLGVDKYNLVLSSLRKGKKTLYENKKINGKNISKYTSKELYDFLKELQEQKKLLLKKLRNLNESATLRVRRELKEKLELKNRLIKLLDEELTYRLTVKKMLREQDEENPLEPLTVDPNAEDNSEDTEEKTENPEEDEEVELSRVVITVANQDAADELKSSLVDAGIPDDAIEFESDEEEEDTEEEDTEEEETEEGNEEEETEESNESMYYKKFRRLLEDDAEDADAEGEDTEEADAEGEDAEGEDAEGEDTEEADTEGEDSPVKVVLTNTDYITDLADVLNDEYGITKDEFEEMIGGEIVDDDEDSEDDESDDEKSEDKESEDKESSKGDDAIDAMSAEDLNDLFGDN